MKFTIFLLFVLGVGCSTPQKSIGPYLDREQLFPSGTYFHRVRIHTPKGEHSIEGVNQITPTMIFLVGLGPLDATLFELEFDRKSKEMKLFLYLESMKPHQEKLQSTFKELISLFEKKRVAAQDASPLQITHYDENQIPSRFQIKKETITVEVEIYSYELK